MAHHNGNFADHASLPGRSGREDLQADSSPLLLLSLLLTLLATIGVWVYLDLTLGFNSFRSDVAWYWDDSLKWAAPFNRVHVPGYPLLIALVRGLVFGALPPLYVLWIITVTSKLLGVALVYRSILVMGSARAAFLGSLLFSVWPFEGIVSVVHPVADSLAIFLTVAGIYHHLKQKAGWAGLFWGLALITHKATWPIIGCLVLFILIQDRRKVRWDLILLTFVPIVLLWGFGSVHHSSITWMFSESYNVEAASRSTLPLLDGLLGAFQSFTIKSLAKGTIVWSMVATAIAVLVLTWRRAKDNQRMYGLAIAIGVLFLFLTLNQHTIWGAVRFSSLLALPAGTLVRGYGLDRLTARSFFSVAILVFLVFLMTQFAFAWYTARIYF